MFESSLQTHTRKTTRICLTSCKYKAAHALAMQGAGASAGSEPTKVNFNYIYPKCNYIRANVITFPKLWPTKTVGGKCNYIQM